MSVDDSWKGTNRRMKMLYFENENGRGEGEINWFGVHTTSISNCHNSICFDNKGYASEDLEAVYKGQGNNDFLAIFAQGICGDVSPKFIHNPVYPFQRGQWEGKDTDDYKSAKYNGKLQSNKAQEIIQLNSNIKLNNNILSKEKWINFSKIDCFTEYTGGLKNCTTGASIMGLAFFGGAIQDGPGAPVIVSNFLRILLTIKRKRDLFFAGLGIGGKKGQENKQMYKVHDPKLPVSETGEKRFLGFNRINLLPLPGFLDKNIAFLKFFYKKTKNLTEPWTPQVLPLQLTRIGNVLIVGFPFEITVIAGKRLEESCLRIAKSAGIEEVILSPYTNGYSGYITTHEEYEAQVYEGGHTVFGKWTLAAIQSSFELMIKNEILNEPVIYPNYFVEKPVFDEEHMHSFSYSNN